MLKDNASSLAILFRFIDILIVYVSAYIAYFYSAAHEFYFAQGLPGFPTNYLIVILIVFLLMIFVFPACTVYRVWRGTSVFVEIKYITTAWVLVGLLLSAIALYTKTGADFSRSWIGFWFLISWFIFVCSRILLRLMLRWARVKGFNQRHIVIVGTGIHAVKIANKLYESNWFGLDISAFFGPVTEFTSEHMKESIVSDDYLNVSAYIAEHEIDQVWLALPHTEEETIRSIIKNLENSAIEIKYVPDVFEFQIMRHTMTSMAGLPVVNISHSPMIGLNKNLKAFEDYLLASIFLVLLSPLMFLIAIIIKLTSDGPVLYKQERLSWNNKPFSILKFRSMPGDVEKESGPVWAQAGENRATTFGAFLRKTSLDELPQLYNVLRGEMSLVGPRPERPVFIEQYKDDIPYYMKKHLVKAGLTGWAQVNGWRGNTSLSTRIEHDLYYIENWSIWFDIKIIFMTIFNGLVNKNAY